MEPVNLSEGWMASRPALTAERLRELLHYCPESGVFVWRTSGSGRNNGEAGWVGEIGYRRIFVAGQEHKAHRLAWLYVNGLWPKGVIDHVDRQRANNRIANLRDVGVAENTQNSTNAGRGSSRHRGVYRSSIAGKWRPEIKAFGQRKHLEYYATEDQAAEAYAAARQSLHSMPGV